MRLKNAFEPLSNFELTAPPTLISLINACLEYAPAKRPATAETVVRRLEKIHSSLTEQSPGRIVATHVRTALDSRLTIKKSSVRRNTDRLPLLIIAFLAGSMIGGLFPILTYRLAGLFEEQTEIASESGTLSEQHIGRPAVHGKENADEVETAVPSDSPASAPEIAFKPPRKPQTREADRPIEPTDAVRTVEQPEQTSVEKNEVSRRDQLASKSDDTEVLPENPRSPEKSTSEEQAMLIEEGMPETKPQPRAPVETPVEPPTLVARLKETYGTQDLLKLLRGEYSKGNYDNVLRVLDELPEPFRGSNLAVIYKLRSLQGLEQLTPRFFKEHRSVSDGEFYLARAQLQYRRENYKQAIQWLDSAAVAPVLMGDLEQIRTQTLVCKARTYTGLYKKTSTMEHRHEALMSWRRVKENLRSVEAQIIEEAIRRIEMLQEDLPDRVIRSLKREPVARND